MGRSYWWDWVSLLPQRGVHSVPQKLIRPVAPTPFRATNPACTANRAGVKGRPGSNESLKPAGRERESERRFSALFDFGSLKLFVSDKLQLI